MFKKKKSRQNPGMDEQMEKGGTGGGLGWGRPSVFSIKQSFVKTKTWQPVCVPVKDDIFRKIPHVFGQGPEYAEPQTPVQMPSSRQGLERPSPSTPPATQGHEIIPRLAWTTCPVT